MVDPRRSRELESSFAGIYTAIDIIDELVIKVQGASACS